MTFSATRRNQRKPSARSSLRLRKPLRALALGLLLGGFACPRLAAAQAARPPVCIPGTALCASVDANGGVHLGANGQGQVGPGGANATGQANSNANTNTNAGAGGEAQPGFTNGPAGYSTVRGRFGVGVTGCPVVRIGVWSGVKAGGCAAVSFRFDSLSFELGTQLLYGGSTRAFDWTFPVSFLVPLGNDESLFNGGYLRFGGSPIGATFGRKAYGGSFVRFGLFAGGGYELALSDAVSWQVIDARLALDLGTRRALDQDGHLLDLGLQLSTGLVL